MVFLPGQSGNPKGRPRMPDWLKSVRKIPKDEFELRIARILQMPMAQIKDMVFAPDAEACDVAIAAIVCAAVSRGDHAKLDWLAKTMICGVDPDRTTVADNIEDFKRRYLDRVDPDRLTEILRDKEKETIDVG